MAMKQPILPSVLALTVALMFLTSCSSGGGDTEVKVSAPVVSQADSRVQEAVETVVSEVEQAKSLLDRAFSYDATGVEPAVERQGNQTSLRFDVDNQNYFMVEWNEAFSYPATLYHFDHLGEDQGFDLAQENDSYFKEELLENAKSFVKDVYGVDCAEATVHAYGYRNKIAVNLETASNQVFSVRYYYKDTEPTGVLFCDDKAVFEQVMERYEAKQYL